MFKKYLPIFIALLIVATPVFGLSIFTVIQGGTGKATLPASQLIYGNGTGAVGSVATTTLTASSPLSLSQAVIKVGGSNSVLTLDTSGSWTGNAGTATALASNGTNCSAGSYPLGVDASGNSENCTVASAGTVTGVTGTWPIISSGGATPAISYAGFGTTSDTGIGNNLILYTSNTGIVKGVASSSLSLPNTALQNSTISGVSLGSNLNSLSVSGSITGTSYNGSAAVSNWALNMANTNSWTALQNFQYSSSTIYSSFLNASTTFLNAGSITVATTSAGCAAFMSSGLLVSTGVACGSGSGGGIQDPFTHPAAGQSATTSLMQLFGQASTSQFTATSSAYLATVAGGVGIGTTTVSKLLYVYGNVAGGIARIHRKLTATTGKVGTLDFLAESDTQMTDGFGPLLNFLAQDQDGVTNTVGQISALRYGADNSGAIVFDTFASGAAISNISMFPSNSIAIGTTTSYYYTVTIASSTQAQLSLSAGAGLAQWAFRNAGGNFYLATTTVAGTATSSVSAFSINANGFPTIPSLGTGLVLSTAGLQSAYAGATCTNQFVRALSVSGAATCATVGSADVSLANLTATNSTLTFSGTYNGSTARTIGLNLGQANTWTGKQTFGAASSTQLSISGWLGIPASANPKVGTTGTLVIETTTASSSLRFYDGTAERALYDTFDKPTIYASSTLAYDGAYGASGTTTYSSIWNPSHALTLVSIYCKTDVGTVWYEVGTGSATSTVQCTTTGASSNTSVNFTLRQSVMEALGRQSSNPSRITVTPTFRYQAD